MPLRSRHGTPGTCRTGMCRTGMCRTGTCRTGTCRTGTCRTGTCRTGTLLRAGALSLFAALAGTAAVARAAGTPGSALGPTEGAAGGGSGRPATDEWPRFRGPGGAATSDAPTVPVRFTEADFNWRTDLPGTGRSSPVVWGGKVFVTSAEKDRGKRHLLCLAAQDGRILWQQSFGFRPRRIHTLNSYAASTPAADGERVCVVMTDPESVTAVAFDHRGRERWRRDLGPFTAQHGPGTSPAMIGGTLIIGNYQEGNESFIVGLESATGRVRWKLGRRNDKASYSTPAELVRDVSDARGRRARPEAVFSSTAHGITSVDPATGKVLWEVKGVFRQRCVSSPVVVSGLVFATAGQGGSGKEAVAVRPPSVASGRAEVAYSLRADLPYVPTAVAVGDLLFVLSDNGKLTCVRGSTGEVLWCEDVGARFYASPVCVSGRLYAVSRKGEVFVIAASEKYELIARSPLGEASVATPAVSRGVMYLRTESRVMSLGGRRD